MIIQQKNLFKWGIITGQSIQIDSGYISQHLVSLITKIPGQCMRGKGLDLIDGSEVKSANFLGSLDKNNKISPRWNFKINSIDDILKTKSYKSVYFISIDLNTEGLFRIRVWRTNFRDNTILNNRYN